MGEIGEVQREQIFQLVSRVLKARNIILAKGVRRPVDQLILHCGDLCAPVLEIIGYVELTTEEDKERWAKRKMV